MQQPSLYHYNYDDLDENCQCSLCVPWRDALNAYKEYMEGKPVHVWACTCKVCKTRMNLYEEVLVRSIKRETFSELTFLVEKHPEKGPFLAWVWRSTQYEGPRKTFSRKWWLDRGAKITLGWWTRKWRMLSGVDMVADLTKKADQDER